MADYKEMYYQLFNKISDIIEELKGIQIEMESIYAEKDIKVSQTEE